MTAVRTIAIERARRMALHAQDLLTPPPRGKATPEAVAAMVKRIGALQLDPVAPVARSPLLVAYARLGTVPDAAIDAAAYDKRLLFDSWAHEASLVHVDDLALHLWALRTLYFPRTRYGKLYAWVDANAEFIAAVTADMRERGPLRASDIEDRSAEPWQHGFWTDEVSSRQTISRVLRYLWGTGAIGVARRHGIERVWDVMERCVPPGAYAAAPQLTDAEAHVPATRGALRMLGVGRAPHVRNHFLRARVPDTAAVLDAQPDVERVAIAGHKGVWYAYTADLEADLPEGTRTIPLSPFDNVLCDRARTFELFGFDHRLEIYVPAEKRRWGYYVLPILHGERFVARADLKVDRAAGVMHVLALHWEPGRRPERAVRAALARLAAWRGAPDLGAFPDDGDPAVA